MLLLTTCGTTLMGPAVTRVRRVYEEGEVKRTEYQIAQPNMHDIYRRHFNAVDLFNRDCFGSHSLQFAIQTKCWWRRMFLALLGMCETNALKAYRHTVGPMPRYEWLVLLSDKLINNPFLEKSSDEESSAEESGDDECGNLEYYQHHMKCAECGASTHWRCPCGYACCRAGAPATKPVASAKKCSAYYRHIRGHA
jgi:hypothetical protein